jgi:DDE family transposase
LLRHYWTAACQDCSLKSQCTTGPERRITRWEHEHLLEAVQQRLVADPNARRQRRETVEHPFGTLKARMGATHFLTKTIPKVASAAAAGPKLENSPSEPASRCRHPGGSRRRSGEPRPPSSVDRKALAGRIKAEARGGRKLAFRCVKVWSRGKLGRPLRTHRLGDPVEEAAVGAAEDAITRTVVEPGKVRQQFERAIAPRAETVRIVARQRRGLLGFGQRN